MTQSQHYEKRGDTLHGEEALKSYRAAQNHLQSTCKNYLIDFKRLQSKIIKNLESN